MKNENLVIGLFLVGLVIVGYFVVAKGDGGFINLSDLLSKDNNTTESNENVTASVSVSDIQAKVLETGETVISFKVISNNANISNVTVNYGLNVADPENATYASLEASQESETYEAKVPTEFGDALYYYIEVTYTAGNETRTYRTETYHLQVKDTYPPTINSVSIDYNGTARQFVISFNATDNDAIAKYYVYWADLGTNNTVTNTTTFIVINSTTIPITITNITDGNYYAFYFKIEDLSGNIATLFNETDPLILQANTSSTWPVTVS
ncbi:hypothetical protein PNA2_1312 [Pyrococcus sp. NA2]|uniref:hypothetical protein n=1 Tax=Pyrococcus sp. (strain NA2) TaxID=342949 RepID=UPI000209AD70|nr:hypothetical protein [Pyrococcus sp. NA2]AEC52227.1 hypothetical protein PNA2_1312 [Pyrococcus sp. NA2]